MFNPIINYVDTNISTINSFTIFGERHSGTNWLESIISKKTNLSITWEYGFKHYPDLSTLKGSPESDSTLFFCITRNIYDWIPAFFKAPYSVDSLIAYNINKFLFNEWKSIDINTKLEILADNHLTKQRRYKNIFELRKIKLEFFYYYLPYLVKNLIVLKYEDLVSQYSNFLNFLDSLFIRTNYINLNCKVFSPRNNNYKLSKKLKQHIDQYTDWNTEKLFGYCQQ
jgi:hypothetical protein